MLRGPKIVNILVLVADIVEQWRGVVDRARGDRTGRHGTLRSTAQLSCGLRPVHLYFRGRGGAWGHGHGPPAQEAASAPTTCRAGQTAKKEEGKGREVSLSARATGSSRGGIAGEWGWAGLRDDGRPQRRRRRLCLRCFSSPFCSVSQALCLRRGISHNLLCAAHLGISVFSRDSAC